MLDGSFDLAISNVPFGNYKLHDPQFNGRNFLIHDYFFARAIEKVRAGGLVVFITSKGTLDKVDGSLRDHLHERADLVGAIRLPNTAFTNLERALFLTWRAIKRYPAERPQERILRLIVFGNHREVIIANAR